VLPVARPSDQRVEGEGVKDSEIILANMNRFNPSFVKFSEEEI
jgi:hypothetical protein